MFHANSTLLRRDLRLKARYAELNDCIGAHLRLTELIRSEHLKRWSFAETVMG